jgi:membrane protein DedA with SNARE-associated domain
MESALLHLFTDLGYAGIIVAMAIQSCCIPLPSEVIMPLAGFLAFQGSLNVWAAGMAGAVGSLIGSVVAYWIGATGGRPLLLRYGRYVLISPHDAERADAFFARHGDATVFFGRLVPIVRSFISLPAGIARMDFGKFVVFSFLGSIPWSVALAYAGYALGQNWNSVGGVLRKYQYVVIALFVILVVLYVYRHLRASTPSSQHSGVEGK